MSQSHPHRGKFGCRHIQLLMYALATFCALGIMVIPSITLLAMEKSSIGDANPEVHNWSESIKNMILSSFLWGFTSTLILSAHLGRRLGVGRVYTLAFAICGINTILTPIATEYGGWQAVLVVRVLTGGFLGLTPPCVYTLMSRWVPIVERGRAGSRVYASGMLGFVVAFASSGAISNSVLGWQYCYYIWGGMAILWSVAFYFVGKPSPADHPTISLEENQYIDSGNEVAETTKVMETPWISILTSVPVWALLITQSANNWGTWMLLTKIPAYMGSVLHYNILENGIMTAIPHLVACLLSFPISYFCDIMIKNGRTSLKTMRKLANTVGLLVPTIAFIGLSFLTSEYRIAAVVILITAVGCNVAVCCGHVINPVDLSPNFSGNITGIVHTSANIIGLLAPLICGMIVPDITNIEQWRRIFYMTAGFYTFGTMIFLFFGDAAVQSWNEPKTLPEVNSPFTISNIIISPEIGTDEEKPQ